MTTFWVSDQAVQEGPYGDLKECMLWLQSAIIDGSGGG